MTWTYENLQISALKLSLRSHSAPF